MKSHSIGVRNFFKLFGAVQCYSPSVIWRGWLPVAGRDTQRWSCLADCAKLSNRQHRYQIWLMLLAISNPSQLQQRLCG